MGCRALPRCTERQLSLGEARLVKVMILQEVGWKDAQGPPMPWLPCCRWGNDSGPRRTAEGVCFRPRGGLEGPKERMLLALNLRVEEG